VRRYLRLAGLCAVFGVILAYTIHEARQPGPWVRVFATREGLVGRRLACGEIIQPGAMFVALPHRSALRRSVELRYRDRVAVVPVLDVGPWNVDDDYWSAGQRPAAERGQGTFRRPANPAGIDLSDATFAALGLRDNDYLEWRFVHRGYIPLPRLAISGAPTMRDLTKIPCSGH
jgi:hypothetical protein